MAAESDYTIEELLNWMGIEATPTNCEQFQVYLDAFNIFRERNERYDDLWRELGYIDNAYNMRHKVARVVKESERGVETDDYVVEVDDGLDIINYAAFWVRNARAGNAAGG